MMHIKQAVLQNYFIELLIEFIVPSENSFLSIRRLRNEKLLR